MPVKSDASEIRFGRFRLDPQRRVLLVDGAPSSLGARAIDVLIALVQRRDRVVGKNELFDLVWPGLVVEENNLQQHVSALRKLLGPRAITTVPGRGYQFIANVEGEAAAPAPRTATPGGALLLSRDNLPAHLPVLIGRAADAAEVHARLAAAPLVTLVGPGGIGKTRLALAVAQAARAACNDGVWFVDLSTLSDPGQVAPAVAHTLAVDVPAATQAASTIAAALRAQQLLLVLDNCEHLLTGVAELAELIGHHAPHVCVLATSREPLRVTGEQTIRLAPLALPLHDEDIAAEPADDRPGAVQLFVARAQSVDRRFLLTPENALLVADICRRLDGVPLAIELAAARLPLLGLEALHDRLDDRLRLLTTGPRTAPWRQQTLRATLDWSHELLTPEERKVFRRLAVFLGGFSLSSVQQVVADEVLDAWTILDVLGQLVDKSLVIVEGDAPRYRLLETMRSYALERLALAGEDEVLRRRHARAMRDLLVEFDRAVAHEPRFDRLFTALETDIDNIRAALAWAAGPSGECELAVAIAAASDWWWNEVDAFNEGLDWCRQLKPWVDESIDAAAAARFRLTSGGLGRVALTSPQEWVADVWQAIDGFRALGDPVGRYRALCLLGGPTGGLVDQQTVGQLLEEAASIEDPAWSPRLRLRRQNALEWWHDLGGRLGEAREAGLRNVALAREAGGVTLVGALSNLADTEFALGNAEAAIALCRQAIEQARRIGRPSALFNAYGNMVPALLERGDLDAAAEAIRAGRAAFVRGLGSASAMLVPLALLTDRRGDRQLAARLIGSADRAYRASGQALHPPEWRARERLLDELRRDLGSAPLAQLLQEGAGWSEDEAFAQAGFGRSAD